MYIIPSHQSTPLLFLRLYLFAQPPHASPPAVYTSLYTAYILIQHLHLLNRFRSRFLIQLLGDELTVFYRILGTVSSRFNWIELGMLGKIFKWTASNPDLSGRLSSLVACRCFAPGTLPYLLSLGSKSHKM